MNKKNKEAKAVNDEGVKIIQKAVDKVGQRTKLLYDLCFAVEILLNDIDQALTFTNNKGMPIKVGFDRDKKKNFNNFLSAVRGAASRYQTLLERDLTDAAEGDWRREQGFRKDTNELIRVCMRYIDRMRCEEDVKRFDEFMDSFPEGDIFPKDIINRFKSR